MKNPIKPIKITSTWCNRNSNLIILSINMAHRLERLHQEVPDLYDNERLKIIVNFAHKFNNSLNKDYLPAPRKGAIQ